MEKVTHGHVGARNIDQPPFVIFSCWFQRESITGNTCFSRLSKRNVPFVFVVHGGLFRSRGDGDLLCFGCYWVGSIDIHFLGSQGLFH